MKNSPVGTELLHVDTRSDTMKIVVLLAILRTRQKRGFKYTPQTFADIWTEIADQRGNSSDIYESWPSYRLSRQRFLVVFLFSLMYAPYPIQLGHCHFLAYRIYFSAQQYY
jgi:hypothetical protein